ncbi:oligopeptide/dipeptide ABC transporter, ATP-binding protein [Desulfitobacterium dichloroeliminans LMG P-21439]|uniref:Oligopeptide/dipeptide ABC transporter, ATP-binding protein n=1 Tax=Desulfitobacterium dichloroeliminans (strain LMG P-21439 / DCA1) TaxID=871963 RepID=L0FBV2_DESDL|nr:ABC transporter ATP-binding protein [Desulfitobacterium dichloroeliminans]AGA70116.1 oligopeptide/dipeptide ABC transporter, ATP-binding protein [Desulfitobacterium dichloroeliminans LMG P-21439]
MHTETPILEVNHLKTYIPTPKGEIKPVDDISFSIQKGEIVALVGESGSGKSVSSLSIMRLNASAIKYRPDSSILFEGRDLLKLKEKELRKIRGNDIAMIFQDPMSALNPVHPIGRQIAEAILLHKKVSYKEAQQTALDLLNKVGIPDAQRRLSDYPHQLSGGMRQRAMIAIALACNPKLLIADEPTTALDVTIQSQILYLLRDLQKKFGISILLITHDLGVVAETADRVLVMYCGKIVEEGNVEGIFANPQHPYTKGLMDSIPSLAGPSKETLDAIPGVVPNPLELPKGCNFVTRCSFGMDKCHEVAPELAQQPSGNRVSCWIHSSGKGYEEDDRESTAIVT